MDNKEADIRRRLVRQGLIKGVIGLPANLFYGTGIPACIVVIDKENAVGRRGIFVIDARKGFRKDGTKNRLRERDIHRIVDLFTEQREVPGYSRMVPLIGLLPSGLQHPGPRVTLASRKEEMATKHRGDPHRSASGVGRDRSSTSHYRGAIRSDVTKQLVGSGLAPRAVECTGRLPKARPASNQ